MEPKVIRRRCPPRLVRKVTHQRRTKFLLILALAAVALFYFSGEARNVRGQGFYQSTVQAMESRKLDSLAKGANLSPVLYKQGQVPSDDNARPATPKVNDENRPTEPTGEDMENVPIAGRTTMKVSKPKDKLKLVSEPEQGQEQSSDEQSAARAELSSILSRAPVVIFSKFHCPHSARAKSIFSKYTIVPTPYVVELDQHPMGSELQKLLAEETGRHTVPNILIGGHSIGGGDETASLDENDELIATVKAIGGERITEAHH